MFRGMRWPRRGILVRLAIYVPVIGFLAWRAAGGCQGDSSEVDAQDGKAGKGMPAELAPHRKVITLPDGTQQEIVELSREEAEAILGHPIPDPGELDAKAAAKGEAKAEAPAADAAGPVD